jgi:hypothetical protein
VYEAVHLMSNREFKKAADLFLDSLATFTCTELISYNSLVRPFANTPASTKRAPSNLAKPPRGCLGHGQCQ